MQDGIWDKQVVRDCRRVSDPLDGLSQIMMTFQRSLFKSSSRKPWDFPGKPRWCIHVVTLNRILITDTLANKLLWKILCGLQFYWFLGNTLFKGNETCFKLKTVWIGSLIKQVPGGEFDLIKMTPRWKLRSHLHAIERISDWENELWILSLLNTN